MKKLIWILPAVLALLCIVILLIPAEPAGRAKEKADVATASAEAAVETAAEEATAAEVTEAAQTIPTETAAETTSAQTEPTFQGVLQPPAANADPADNDVSFSDFFG